MKPKSHLEFVKVDMKQGWERPPRLFMMELQETQAGQVNTRPQKGNQDKGPKGHQPRGMGNGAEGHRSVHFAALAPSKEPDRRQTKR